MPTTTMINGIPSPTHNKLGGAAVGIVSTGGVTACHHTTLNQTIRLLTTRFRGLGLGLVFERQAVAYDPRTQPASAALSCQPGV